MIFRLICIKSKGLWVPSVRSMLLCCLKQMRVTCLWPYLKDDNVWIITNSIIYPKRQIRKYFWSFFFFLFHSAVIGMELCAVPLLFGWVINVILMYCDTFVSENSKWEPMTADLWAAGRQRELWLPRRPNDFQESSETAIEAFPLFHSSYHNYAVTMDTSYDVYYISFFENCNWCLYGLNSIAVKIVYPSYRFVVKILEKL